MVRSDDGGRSLWRVKLTRGNVVKAGGVHGDEVYVPESLRKRAYAGNDVGEPNMYGCQ